MTPSINPQMRDMRMQFQDSCNCCSKLARKPKDSTPVFVKKSGSVARFNPPPGGAKESAHLAISNLMRRITEAADMAGEPGVTFRRRIETLAQIDFFEIANQGSPMTAKQIKKINKALPKALRAAVREAKHTPPPSKSSTTERLMIETGAPWMRTVIPPIGIDTDPMTDVEEIEEMGPGIPMEEVERNTQSPHESRL